MLDKIKSLSLAEKKTLLAMLQADLGLIVNTEIVVAKPNFYQIETARCNKVAEIKKAGGSVIYTEYQMVD